MLQELFTLIFTNIHFNLLCTLFATATYLINLVVFRLRKAYLPMNNGMALIMMICPALSFCLLILNILILSMNVSGYHVKKKRMTKSTYKYHRNSIDKQRA